MMFPVPALTASANGLHIVSERYIESKEANSPEIQLVYCLIINVGADSFYNIPRPSCETVCFLFLCDKML